MVIKGNYYGFKGRRNDWIRTEEGEKINPYAFIRAVEAVNFLTDHSVIQYQIIQRDYKEFLVKLVVDEPMEEIIQIFLDNIGDEKLKQASYQFAFYDALFPDDTGKMRCFICEM